MNKCKIFCLFLQLFAVTACSIKYASFDVLVDGKAVKYRIPIPKGSKQIPADYQHARGKVFLYSDSSSFFFTNDVKSGMIYPEKFKKYGSNVGMKFLSNDTIVLMGTDDQGRYWEERKIKNIVYGYMKVPATQKEVFDRALNSILVKTQ